MSGNDSKRTFDLSRFADTPRSTCVRMAFQVCAALYFFSAFGAFKRLASDQLPLTQELIAQMLGVRRTTVTILAQALQGRGAIKYTRGRITILDRDKLMACACDCYTILAKENYRL